MRSTLEWAAPAACALVIALGGGLLTISTLWAQQSEKLGRTQANNENLSSQNAELRQQNAALRERLDTMASTSSSSRSDAANLQKALEDHKTWLTQAYSQIEHLQAEKSRLAFLADSKQRCAPYREEITALQEELAGSTTFTVGAFPEPERKAEITAHLKEHHANLRACLGAQP